ncbi:MAG TPA: hypothetical protein VF314_17995 [Actinomycetes bacterium]
MSRERAHRRAERDRQRRQEIAARERTLARRARRRAARQAVVAKVPRRTRWRRQQGILARRRRAQNSVILGLFLLSQILVWLVTGDPWLRATAALVAVLSLPVLVTLALDRRS